MEALKLIPAFKDYIWGGTRLRDEYGKKCNFERIAESWELSCHKDGNSIIENGEYAGITLAEYIEKEGKYVLGSNCGKFADFPILIKLIDARDNLSVQVHPNNEYAMMAEGEYGKTEMWYIVDCEEGASLLYGFNKCIAKDEFRQHIENGTLLDVTNKVPVKKGDVFFIKSGTLHAIGKGILIAEIQQNSNTTYRVYDYGRVGNDGKPRELHIEKAVEVTDLCQAKEYSKQEAESFDGYKKKLLASCEYFTVYSINIESKVEFTAGDDSFNSILVLDGGAVLSGMNGSKNSLILKKGDSIFVPAGYGNYKIKGIADIIFTKV